MTTEQMLEITKEGWKTLGTMMLTEYLLTLENAPEEQIAAQRNSIEKYREALIRQTQLAMNPDEKY